MRIAFVLPTFSGGGAERVASLLCNYWVGKGHIVSAVTFEAVGTTPAYTLDGEVALHQIDCLNPSRRLTSRLGTNIRRLFRLRTVVKELAPDVLVAFTTEANVVTLWATRGIGIPVIVSERNQPVRPGLGLLIRAARRFTYPSAAAIVVQTDDIARWASQYLTIPIRVLPNPIQLTSPQALRRHGKPGEKRLVAVGRLVPQKGFDLLIGSFARIASKHPDWTLSIYGEGPDRDVLEAQIQKAGLEDRIALPGFHTEIDSALYRADLFVLSSRYEGYPNALLEALAAGCAVVATNCPGATAEILKQGKHGVLVPSENISALSSALNRAMSDAILREDFTRKARQGIEHLDVVVIGERWLDLFRAVRSQDAKKLL